MPVSTITPTRLRELQQGGAPIELIDVRTPAEFRELHADGARNVPLDRLDPERLVRERAGRAVGPLYLICRSGARADMACRKFLAAGHANVVSVEGGTVAWEQAGLPVTRGKKAMSLERQVRIAAGSLALLGAVLALTVHPYFAGLSAFIGAGLVFAGVTDTCGMGMVLARMPWNQVAAPSGPAACCANEKATAASGN